MPISRSSQARGDPTQTMIGTDHNSVDPSSGYCFRTKTFHSLRTKAPIPPSSLPISITDFLLLNRPDSIDSTTTFLIDAFSDHRLSFSDFLSLSNSLSLSITSRYPSLSKSDVAFILSPNSLHVPVLYFALLSLGVILSPASPLGSPSDIEHQLRLTRPSIAFATSETSSKLPKKRFALGIVLIDSPEFYAMLTDHRTGGSTRPLLENVNGVVQSDTATVLYSSGTTGRVKGVVMSHRSMIGGLSRCYNPSALTNDQVQVSLLPLPLFHVYGLFMVFRGFALGTTLVLLTDRKKFQVEGMLRIVERYQVNMLPASPPVVVAMLKLRSEDRGKHDLRSLKMVGSGGAPLGKEVSRAFQEQFPSVMLVQVS